MTSKDSIFVCGSTNIPAVSFQRKGAFKTEVRDLIDERHGSRRCALRLFSIEKGGHTPVDRHDYEHAMYVLKGQGILRKELGEESLRNGDVAFIPSNAIHQFINENDEPLVYVLINVFTREP